MRTLVQFIRRFTVRDEGQTLTEYGLLLFFVAVAAIVAVTALGVNVAAVFQNLADRLAGV
jgi:pilus assembly protein Flp/PilA